MTSIFADTFDAALNTTNWLDEAAPPVWSTSGGLLGSSTSNFRVLKTTTSAHAAIENVKVSAIRGSGAGFDASVCARCTIAGAISNSGSTYWANFFGTDTIEITRRVGGSTTLLATRNLAHTVGSKMSLEVVTQEDTNVRLRVFVDDVQAGTDVIDSSATRILGAAQTGVFVFTSSSRFDAFDVDDLSVATQDITHTGIGTASAFGAPTISNVTAQEISPSGLASAAVYGSHLIGDVSLTITPGGLASAAVYGAHSFAGTLKTIEPAGKSSAAVFGGHTIANSADTITPSGVASAGVFGSTVIVKEVGSQGVPSAAVYGNTALLLEDDKVLLVPGRATAAVYGSPTIATVTPDVVSPGGRASMAVFGAHLVSSPLENAAPQGVASAFRPGHHRLIGGVAPAVETYNIQRPTGDKIRKKVAREIIDIDGDEA